MHIAISQNYISRTLCFVPPYWMWIKQMTMKIKLPSVAGFQTLFMEHNNYFSYGAGPPSGPGAPRLSRPHGHTQTRTTICRTPLDEWSARRRDLYLTTPNTHNRQPPRLLAGFEPTISASERPQTHALDRASPGSVTLCTMGGILF
jgi:hypothetical protein